jgi:alpha-L-fucosidase
MLGNVSFVQLIAFVVLSYSMAAGGQKPVSKPATPTPEQVAWQNMEVGMFIHFGSRTWTGSDKVALSLDKMNPSKLNTDQWVAAAEAMGAKYIVFVAKHKTGFCMWQTNTTDFSVKSIPWRNGKGDVLADLAESCRKRGIKLGVYLSPTDHHFGSRSRGRCKTKEAQDRYNKIFRQQLTEVLSRYGEMVEVWFDGSLEIEVGDILKKYAPNAMILNTAYATIRYVGNESGMAPYPAWNAVSETAAKSGASRSKDGNPDGTVWLPVECPTEIRTKWFWKRDNTNNELDSLDDLMAMYYRSVGYGAVLLLNHTPDTRGLIPEADFERGAEFGAEVRRRFGKSIAETQGQGESVELSLDEPTFIDHIITMEDITHGERVRKYVIEGWLVDGHRQIIVEGTAIGHKKIDQFPLIKVSKVRFRALESVGTPRIRKLAVYSITTDYPN